jgi:hypothetical protein
VSKRDSLLAVLVLALATAPLAAQDISGTIIGTVTDESGAVLPGVTVTLRNTATGIERSAVTGAGGVYTAPALPIGTYDLTFEPAGFLTRSVQGIELHVNDRLEINMKLGLSGVEETVVVTAASSSCSRRRRSRG